MAERTRVTWVTCLRIHGAACGRLRLTRAVPKHLQAVADESVLGAGEPVGDQRRTGHVPAACGPTSDADLAIAQACCRASTTRCSPTRAGPAHLGLRPRTTWPRPWLTCLR